MCGSLCLSVCLPATFQQNTTTMTLVILSLGPLNERQKVASLFFSEARIPFPFPHRQMILFRFSCLSRCGLCARHMSYAPYLHWGEKAEEREGERERHPHRFAEHLKFQVHGKGREDDDAERERERRSVSRGNSKKCPGSLVHF